MTAGVELQTACTILEVEGSLREPVSADLYDQVATLLEGGERRIVLNLARISEIDAAGVGELVRVFNLIHAAGGELHVEHEAAHVRRLLLVTGLSALFG